MPTTGQVVDNGYISGKGVYNPPAWLCVVAVRFHCGGWPEEVNTCFLNSYMVYL